MKIENRSHKRSHKLDGIGVGKFKTVSFYCDSVYDSIAYDPVNTRLSESEAEAEAEKQGLESNIMIGLFFRFCFRLRL